MSAAPTSSPPSAAALRLNGRTIAHYVLSVQDDLGYVKLVSRFLGVPLVMRVGSHAIPSKGVLPGPASIPDGRPAHLQATCSIRPSPFPHAPSPAVRCGSRCCVPLPASLSARSCAAIKSAELGARRTADLATASSSRPRASPPTSNSCATLTDGLLYIRAGSRLLAGSTPRGPAQATAHRPAHLLCR